MPKFNIVGKCANCGADEGLHFTAMEFITQKDRLLIASQQLAGLMAPGYRPQKQSDVVNLVDTAISFADELIRRTGFQILPVDAIYETPHEHLQEKVHQMD